MAEQHSQRTLWAAACMVTVSGELMEAAVSGDCFKKATAAEHNTQVHRKLTQEDILEATKLLIKTNHQAAFAHFLYLRDFCQYIFTRNELDELIGTCIAENNGTIMRIVSQCLINHDKRDRGEPIDDTFLYTEPKAP